MDETKRIITVNGIKMEVDLRQAKVVDNYRVGDMVKVLNKEYNDSYKVYPGIVTDFFVTEKEDGTCEAAIQILALKKDYSSVDLVFMVYGENTKNFSISHFNEYEKKFDQAQIDGLFDNEITKFQEQIRVLETKQSAYKELFCGVTNGK